MKRLVLLPVALIAMVGFTQSAQAEPAWGVNCLSCHGEWYADVVSIVGEDTTADPDESGTGAPDRGTLPVFQVAAGQVKTLTVDLAGLVADDVYAMEFKRIRYPGVVNGGVLTYGDDCDWAYWGSPGKYYTDPPVGFTWGADPTSFSFDVEVGVDAAVDYYDLVFAVAGQLADDVTLFYAEQHFYLEVTTLRGDMDVDGDVDTDDFTVFEMCFTGAGGRLADGCEPGDFDGDTDIDCADWSGFQTAWTEPTEPPDFDVCMLDIPTVSQWGIVAMLLLIMTGGTLVFQRRAIQTG